MKRIYNNGWSVIDKDEDCGKCLICNKFGSHLYFLQLNDGGGEKAVTRAEFQVVVCNRHWLCLANQKHIIAPILESIIEILKVNYNPDDEKKEQLKQKDGGSQ